MSANIDETREVSAASDRRGVDATHHPDRFDRVKRTHRVGAHRASLKTGSPWTAVMIAALATIVLTAIGILVVTLQPGSVSFMDRLNESQSTGQAPDEKNVVVSEIDPNTTVVVLNGTSHDGFAFLVDEIINDEGWGTTLFSGEADQRDVEISAIFYADEAHAGLAKGLGEKLGGISYYLNSNYTAYDNQLTVLIGSDYRGPASDLLKEAPQEP